MSDKLFVILLDGRPYFSSHGNRAIRTYLTRERAEQEAQKMAELDRKYPSRGNRVYQVGVFSAQGLTVVSAD